MTASARQDDEMFFNQAAQETPPAAGRGPVGGRRTRASNQQQPSFHFLFLLILIQLAIGERLVRAGPQQLQQLEASQQQALSRTAAELDKQLLRKSLAQAPEAAPAESQQDSSGGASSASGQLSTNNSGGAFQCPEQFGYYTDTRDCTKYYVCVFGEVLHESCTGGLRFSRELQTCDWPRNVDCPQLKEQQQTTTSIPITTTTTGTSTAATTTQSSASGQQNRQQQQSGSNAKEGSAEADEPAGGSLKGASLVFADEGSDPQQPSFDEAVSPVITSDGTIHLHDGSGGTFSLTPNHNRAQQPQPASDNERQTLDVFVKPLNNNLNTNNNRRPQQMAGSGRTTAPSQLRLQPATLPAARPRNTFAPANSNQEGGSPEESDSGTSGDDSTGQPGEESAGGEPLDSEAPKQNGGELSNAAGDELEGEQFNQPTTTSYIPPVMAQQPAGGQMRQQAAGSAPQAGRQSSQLLSINNRQIDPSRQSFKPMLVQPLNLIQSNQFANNNNNNNPRLRPAPAQEADGEPGADDSRSATAGSGDDEEPAGQPQLVSSSSRPFNLQPAARGRQASNQTLSGQQRQQQQQMVAAAAAQAAALQNNRQSRMSNQQQQFQHQMQNANLQLLSNSLGSGLPLSLQAGGPGEQMRPARFFSPSPQQQQQQQTGHSHHPNPAQTSPTTTTTNQQQSFLSNNVNFNDSSKLIRLQASHFEPSPAPPADLSQPPPASGNLFLNNNNNNNRFQPQARSQNVLFSQQPFGLMSGDAGNNGAELAGQRQAEQQPQPATGSFAVPSNSNSLLQQQRRPRPPKRQQIPSGGSGSSSSSSSNNLRSRLNSQPNRFVPEPTIDTTTSTTASTPGNFLPASEPPLRISNQRPIVAPTTVNFLQPEPQPEQATAFATAPSVGGAPPPGTGRRPKEQRAGSGALLQASQQPPAATLATSTQPSTSTSLPISVNSNSNNPQEQDPQAVANRYLNSAIDALEAGQPFGTVDYDFDILNDNSTDRRQNTSRARPEELGDTVGLSNGRPPGSQQRGRTSGGRPNQQQQPGGSATTSGASQPTATTKKPRPTNKKIAVSHEQALANNRASTEPAKRPEALFSTPNALQTATKCDPRHCRLPDCKCGDTLTPGALKPDQIPQVVLLTFDDAVNDLNWEIYEEIFTGRTNPNGCPILATFYVSHEWTDYGQVQTLYSRGHEMASHSVTHSFGEKFSKNQWFKEINGQREILNMYGGVKMNDVRGMRAPFLQIGGNKMFEMLYDANFTYDSSMPIFENSPPLWPYTLDYQLAHECMITPCPTKSFPGVWEVGMTMWVDLRGGRCSMGDACSNPADEEGVYEMLMKNFNRHYKSNRAPFGLFYHSAWFNTVHHRRGFIRFMGTVNSLPDVYFTTNWQMLQWMRRPTPLQEINNFEPWQCPAKSDRPPPCFHPSVCNVKSEHGTRFMKTCQPCPANQQYPWVGATGFKGKQQAASGSG